MSHPIRLPNIASSMARRNNEFRIVLVTFRKHLPQPAPNRSPETPICPLRFISMTGSMTSPHCRHCQPGTESPLASSRMIMARRNPPPREQYKGHSSRSNIPADGETDRTGISGNKRTSRMRRGEFLLIRERRRLENQTRRNDAGGARDGAVSVAQALCNFTL